MIPGLGEGWASGGGVAWGASLEGHIRNTAQDGTSALPCSSHLFEFSYCLNPAGCQKAKGEAVSRGPRAQTRAENGSGVGWGGKENEQHVLLLFFTVPHFSTSTFSSSRHLLEASWPERGGETW